VISAIMRPDHHATAELRRADLRTHLRLPVTSEDGTQRPFLAQELWGDRRAELPANVT